MYEQTSLQFFFHMLCGPLLARSGYPGQDASFYNNPMIMICETVNAFTLL